MKCEISILDDRRVVLIEVAGDMLVPDILAMRRRTVEIADDTGYTDFIVDIRRLKSIAAGCTFTTYDLGDSFSESGFSVWNNTAVLMPADARAREQAEFLHTVEVNRGRGLLNYVESIDEAITWFGDMAQRSPPPAM